MLSVLLVSRALAIAVAAVASVRGGAAPAAPYGAVIRADTVTAADSAALQFPDSSGLEYLSSVQDSDPPPAERPQNKTTPALVRVLFIGNSSIFENDMPRIFHALMVSGHRPCVVGMVTIGGANLSTLWNVGRARRVIRDYPWDYVILQEKETADSANFVYYARRFHREIVAKHAQTILYPQYFQDPGQRNDVEAQNVAVAQMLTARVAPVVPVWATATATDSSLELFEDDGFHPSDHGAYLNALMMYHMITGQSPIGLPAHVGPVIIPDPVATILQHVATIERVNPATQPPLRNSVAAMPVLTVDVLARMTTFWTRFMREPDSIRTTGRQAHQHPLFWSVGPVQENLRSVVDMDSMVTNFPAVATDLHQSGLTAQEWVEDYLALVSAWLADQWEGLASERAASSLPATSVLRRNIAFLRTHPQELAALKAAGMRLPYSTSDRPRPPAKDSL